MKPNEIYQHLLNLYPNAHCELIHRNAYELIVAVALSAQTTDKSVNKVTPQLFNRYPTVSDLANGDTAEIETYIRSIGLYKTKAKNIKSLAQSIVNKFDGHVPDNMDDLKSLDGVGQKTANVVLSVWFNQPAIAVDTHVERISKRLRLAYQNDSVFDVERKLMRKFPKEIWSNLHHLMIFFGRYTCKAKNPDCNNCPFQSFCYYYKRLNTEAK